MSDPGAPFDRTLLPAGLLDLDLEVLADEFGTPLFVYDETQLRRRCRDYVEAFGEGSVAYAGKAFLCVAMVRLVDEEGLHLDVATGGELHLALRAGLPARPHRVPRQQQERCRDHGGARSRQSVGSSPTRSTSSTDSNASVSPARCSCG